MSSPSVETALETERSQSVDPLKGTRPKILMVDDSPENLMALEAVLDGTGDLVKATSGMEALRRLLEDDFAAILLDVKMPVMDGFETATLIRQRKRSQHTPILFLTGYKNEEHLFRGYDLGAVDFLFKPIVPEILRSKVAVFVQLSQDQTLLRRQAEALRKTEHKFRALVEAAPDAMIITDEKGVIELVNSRVESLLGYTRDELLRRNVTSIVLQWSPGPRTETELTARRKDGREFPVEMTLSPLSTEEGVVVISAIRDITERRKAEAAIREMNQLLEDKVNERTADLMRSNDELRQFAYVASHDLKEPLRLVSTYSQLLGQRYGRQIDAEADRLIEFIVQSANRMESLIDDLLSFSRLDAREVSFKPCDLGMVIAEALLNLQVVISESRAEITHDPPPQVTGNHVQLVQLFQNLLSNALKYRTDEKPQVRLSVEERDSEWLFRVQDNGIGIEPQYAESIFGLFKRLHGGGRYQGNGVGLTICKKIVERHGGRIWVESKLGAGSTFCFTLKK